MAELDSKKNPKKAFQWLLWWQIDEDELVKQVTEYETLNVFQSSRGISLLLLLFSSALTSAFIVFFNWELWSFIDVFAFVVLGFFIYWGQRWAMIAAMILWTVEKVSSLFSGGISNPIVLALWWSTYLHAFYLAFKVEGLYRQMKATQALQKGKQ